MVAKKQALFNNLLIKKIAAAAMLFLFAFSITPVIVFHNWLADHTDTVKKPIHTNGGQLGKKTFNCNCDNIVAESPFTRLANEICTIPKQFFVVVKVYNPVYFKTSLHIFYSLRGPPVV